MGGFGRFQWLATALLCLTRNSGNFFYYTFGYMTLEQIYKCSFDSGDTFSACSIKEDICPALANGFPIEFQVDTSYDYYLNNWFVQMDLMCESKMRTNFMLSAYYISYAISGFLFFAIPEIYGRRKTLLAILALSVVGAQQLLMFGSVYWVRLLGFFVQGFC